MGGGFRKGKEEELKLSTFMEINADGNVVA